MSSDVTTKLEFARNCLVELGKLTFDLIDSSHDAFSEPEFANYINDFKIAYSYAQERLANPTLIIATIGTTSSGKSTMVNALVGRRIAPIEAGEMSGGVLTIRSGSERRLTIEEAAGAPWEHGTWINLSDEDAYLRIRDRVMKLYHETRKSRSCPAPEVLSEGPLLPSVDSSLLGLPPNLSVEFIDLPGLKSLQDRDNLAVIQSRVRKAFSIVAIDYSQTDENQRKKLFEELTSTVRYLDGRTDSMIFVLNRVDKRGNDDIPIEERVASLRREIKDVLTLQTEPDILPFEARLLYRAQCAWGAADSSRLDTTKEQQVEHLRGLFDEAASTLKRRSRENPQLKSWLRDIEDQVENNTGLADDDLRKLLEYSLEWSGGKELWRRLRTRIEDSFAELVILPALIDVFNAHSSFMDALKTVSQIRKINSQEQLKRERERLERLQQRFHEGLSATRERFRHQLTTASDGLKSGDQAIRARLAKELGPGFESLLNAVNEVTGDLTKSLIAPMRDALKEKCGTYELEERMGRVVEPVKAKELARAYDLFKRHLDGNGLSRENGKLKWSFRKDEEKVKLIETIERDARRLYQNMRECLSARAEFILQAQAESIRSALMSLLEQQSDAITAACLTELPDLSLDQAIESARRARSRSDMLKLPEQFFTLLSVEKTTEKKPTRSCFGGSDSEENDYIILVIPDENGMAQQWSSGVKGGEESLWTILRDWMIKALLDSSVNFSTVIESILRLADRALEQQQRLAVDEHEAIVKFWKRVDQEIVRTIHCRDQLSQTAKSERR